MDEATERFFGRCSTAFCRPALSDSGMGLSALANTIFCFALDYGMIAFVHAAMWLWYQTLSIPARLAGRRRTIRATAERRV